MEWFVSNVTIIWFLSFIGAIGSYVLGYRMINPTSMRKIARLLFWSLLPVAIILSFLLVAVWATTFHPYDIQEQKVICPKTAPILKANQSIKIMSWNVQYMAGTERIFFYDTIAQDGPDERPSAREIRQTLHNVAKIIREENPDIILLQEVHENSIQTDYKDQLAQLRKLLPAPYNCYTQAFYWWALFVPHPRILGSAGMKLCIISKYKIGKAMRHQLPLIPKPLVYQQFNFKRAILQAHFPVEGGRELVVLNTHLDAFASGDDTMSRQVDKVATILQQLDKKNLPWVIGGDFNLLPPGNSYNLLPPTEKKFHNPHTEIATLMNNYPSVPSLQEVTNNYQRWLTGFPKDKSRSPKIIDYFFFSKKLKLGSHYVINTPFTRSISDHLPLVAQFFRMEKYP